YSLVHYGNVAMLLVAATTLVLFFATGMYSEKIAYAHKFVPQANRALRPFNIYLNTRHRSRFSIMNLFRSTPPSPASAALSRTPSGHSISSDLSSPPLSRRTSASSTHSNASSSTGSFRSQGAFRSPPVTPPASPPLHTSQSPPVFPSPPLPPRPSSSPSHPPSTDPVTRAPVPPPTRSSTLPPGGGVPIPPIPPAQNPRGEIIFSSRVAPQFREGYERYRGEWERRRAEAKRMQREREGGWIAWAVRPWSWGKRGSPLGAGVAAGQPMEKAGSDEKGKGREPRSRETSIAPSEPDGDGTGTTSDGGIASFPPSRSPSPPLEPLLPPSRAFASLPSSALLSSTSTPASSAPPSRSPSPHPATRSSPRRSSLSSVRGGGTPGRVRAESFSELIELENEGEQERPDEAPGMRRSGSLRGLGLGP
ncbi:hypothetical protein JCM11251_005418, partial [Rhodosporidiobolus azoricus]